MCINFFQFRTTDILSGPSAAPHRPILILYIFWLLPNWQLLLHKITFLDTCQKMVSTDLDNLSKDWVLKSQTLILYIFELNN